MLADLFQLPVELNADADASARGAILLGMEAAFPHIQFPAQTNQVLQPNASVAYEYKNAFLGFEQLSKALVPHM